MFNGAAHRSHSAALTKLNLDKLDRVKQIGGRCGDCKFATHKASDELSCSIKKKTVRSYSVCELFKV